MNEKDIYELIGNSFEDKVKLDFDDVKKRIEKLDENKTAVITPMAPSRNNTRRIFAVVGAAAACLVCVFGLSVFFSQFSGAKEEASYALYDTEAACEESEIFYAPTENEAYGYYSEDNADGAYAIVSDHTELTKEPVSDSDISQSDISSDSDIE